MAFRFQRIVAAGVVLPTITLSLFLSGITLPIMESADAAGTACSLDDERILGFQQAMGLGAPTAKGSNIHETDILFWDVMRNKYEVFSAALANGLEPLNKDNFSDSALKSVVKGAVGEPKKDGSTYRKIMVTGAATKQVFKEYKQAGHQMSFDDNLNPTQPETKFDVSRVIQPGDDSLGGHSVKPGQLIEGISDGHPDRMHIALVCRSQKADLSIEKSGPDEATFGQTISYQVAIANQGPSTAKNVLVTDPIPLNLQFVPQGSDSRCHVSGSDVLCDIGTLAPTGPQFLTLNFRTDAQCASYLKAKNFARIKSTTTDPVMSNNTSDTVYTRIDCPEPSLSIQKDTQQTEVFRGDTVSYDIVVTNAGAGAANDVIVRDPIPTLVNGTVTFVPQQSDSRCEVRGSDVACALNTLSGNQEVRLRLTFKAGSETDQCRDASMRNSATVTASNDQSDTDSAASVAVRCRPESDLSIDKSVSPSSIVRGETATYTIRVRNNGAGTAQNVTLNDQLPSLSNGTVSIESVSTTKGTCSQQGTTVNCSLEAMTQGAEATITIVTRFGSAADSCNQRENLQNRATLSATGKSSITSNPATVTVNCPVVQRPDLSIEKTVNPQTIGRGETATYEIMVRNNGEGVANTVVVNDTIQGLSNGNVSIESAVSNSGTCSINGNSVSCQLGSIQGHQDASVRITVRYGSSSDACSTTAQVPNRATVSASGVSTKTSNSTSLSVECRARPSLQIQKKVDKTTAQYGDALRYTVTVTNNGQGEARNVNVRDQLPSSVTAQSAEATQGSCSIMGSTIDCLVGNLSAGESAEVEIEVTINAQSASYCSQTIVKNTAKSLAENVNAVTSNTVSTTVNCKPKGNLTLVKTASKDSITRGDSLIYRIVVTNSGQGYLSNVVFHDTVPTISNGSVTVDDAHSTQGSCSVVPGNAVECDLGSLAPGESATVIIEVTVSASTAGNCAVTSMKNAAKAGADGINSVGSNPVSTTVNCKPKATLTIAKTASQSEVARGDSFSYTITVTNAGLSDAENVQVKDQLPSIVNGTFTIDSVNTTHGSCITMPTSTLCEIGTLNPGETATVTIHVQVSALQTSKCSVASLKNVAYAAADGLSAKPSNPVSVTVNCPAQPKITLIKTASSDTVSFGETITYTIQVTNSGLGAANFVDVSDQMPNVSNGSVTVQSVTTTDGVCGNSSTGVSCELGTLNAGETATIEIVAKVSAALEACSNAVIKNVAIASGQNFASVNSNWVSTNVKCPAKPKLTLTKTASAQEMTRGGTITYTVTVKNTGAGAATNVNVTDEMPNINNGSVTVQSVTSTDGFCSNATDAISCDIPSLAGNQSVTITIVAQVSAATGMCTNAVIKNVAIAAADNASSVTSNWVSSTVKCPPVGSLTIAKTASSQNVIRGGSLTYTITVSNTSQAAVQNAVVTDTMANSLAVQSATTTQGACATSASDVTCDLGTVEPGASVTITITVIVGSALEQCSNQSIQNKATVTGTGMNARTSNTVTTTVTCPQSSVSIVKTVSATSVTRGGTLTYTITVSNTGNGTAHNAMVTDSIPSIGNGTVVVNSAAATQGICTIQGGNVSCALGSLAPQTQATVTIVVTVGSLDDDCKNSSVLNNYARFEASNSTGKQSNTVQTTVNCGGQPSITISKSAPQSSVTRGGTMTYTILVKNTGTATAPAISISDTMPNLSNGTITVQGVTSTQGACVLGQTVTCSLGSLAPNETATVAITAVFGSPNDTCNGTQTVNNVATGTYKNNQTVTSNTVSTQVQCAAALTGCINITKYAFDYVGNLKSPTPQFTFKLDNNQAAVSDNNGHAQFTGVAVGQHTVTENVPTGWTLLSTVPASGTVNVTAGNTCANVFFSNKQNQIIGEGEVNISKTDNVTTINQGQTLTYQITLTNTSSQAQTVTVTDPLGSLVTFLSASDNGTLNGSTVTWTNLVVNGNSTKNITLLVKVNDNATNGAQIVNIAYVGSKSSTDITTIQGQPTGSLTLTIEDTPDPVRPCESITYTIRVTNNGSASQSPTLDLTYQNSDLSFISASDSGFQNNNGVRWTNLTINGNSTRTVTTVARVSCSASHNEIMRSTATVSSSTAEANTTVKDDNDDNGDTEVTIRDEDDPVQPGDEFDYTITVRNNDNVRRCGDLTLDLDSDTTFLDATGNGDDDRNDRVRWDNVCIDRDDSKNFRATVRVRSSAEDGDELEAEARFLGDTDTETTDVEEDGYNDRDPVDGQEFTLTKSADRFEANPGDEVMYTITIRNGGDEDLRNVQLIDTFPEDMQIMDPAAGSLSNGRLEWMINVNRNQVRTIVYRARISTYARGGDVVRNTVTAQGGNLDTNRTAIVDVRVLGGLPQTGASSYTGSLEDSSRFLSPYRSAQAGSGMAGLIAYVLGSMGLAGAGFLGKRFFL